jgi:lipopolysaccharide export system protein LptA
MRPNDEASRRMRLTIPRPRFTIERLRNVLLVGGALLVVAIVVFLAAGQWTRRFLNKDLPSRLGINIEQHADVVTYTQTRKGKTIFKIQSSRADTMKSDGSTLLHDVKIDLYGEDGNRTDTISGSEFNYDPKAGVATAAGAVEITMMRPGVKPAITQLKPGSAKPKPAVEDKKAVSAPTSANSSIAPTPGSIANEITDDEIHVKTNGLIFNQKTGVATTTQRVDFALRQGNGNSIGATYDSQHGQLVLDRAVELLVHRPSGAVAVHAGHAEFEHGNMLCRLTSGTRRLHWRFRTDRERPDSLSCGWIGNPTRWIGRRGPDDKKRRPCDGSDRHPGIRRSQSSSPRPAPGRCPPGID